MPRQARKTSGTGICHVIRYALSFGAGFRQLSLLTGVSFGVIQMLKNDHQIRPHDLIPGENPLPLQGRIVEGGISLFKIKF